MDFHLVFIVFFLLSISLAIFLLSSLRVAREWSSPRGYRLPPGPGPLEVVRSLLELSSKPHRSLASLAKTHGPLMSIKLGSITMVVASSPEFAREILQKHDEAFSSRTIPNVVYALNHPQVSVAWIPTNQTWRNLRKIFATQLTSPKALDATQALRRQKVRELIEFVHQNCRMRKVVDIGEAAFMTTLNLMSNLVFSVDAAAVTSKSTQLGFKDIVGLILGEIGKPDIADIFPWLGWVDPQGRRRQMAHHRKKLHKFFDEMIDRRLWLMQSRTEAVATPDLLDLLLLNHQVDGNSSRPDRHAIKSVLVDTFLAGTGTLTNTVEWAMAELLRNPKSMAAVQEELTRAISSEKEEVDESDISRLPYLQAVVKETFRLHPVGPLLLPHKAKTSVELHGYTVPKDTHVLVNVWAIGRDPDVWPDPELFFPERFLGMDVDFRGQHFELIPFGSGRRICPGLAQGNRMLHLMMASLLRWFDWKLPNGMHPDEMDMTEKSAFTLGIAVPLRAIPINN